MPDCIGVIIKLAQGGVEERMAKIEGAFTQVDQRLGRVEVIELRRHVNDELSTLREHMHNEIGSLRTEV